MNANAFSVPWLCCSAPRADSTIAVAASPMTCAARTICSEATPVMRSTRSGQYDAQMRLTLAQPLVRVSMNAWSISLSRIATCSSPLASAVSVPGVSWRCRCASLAVAVSRGSTTISLPPRRRWSSKYCITGGMVSAGLPPASSTASAPGMSSSGNGSPRSMPNALTPAAAAEAMQNRPL